jgi:hypothetical protein
MEDVARFLRISRKMNKKEFSRWFDRAWSMYHPSDSSKYVSNVEGFEGSLKLLQDGIDRVGTSVMGIATGVYPIHLLSHQKIPYELFRETDDAYFRTTYRRIEGGGHYFEIFPSGLPETKFYFAVPEYILSKYQESLKRFKMDFLEWIDVPVTLGPIRRVLRFKLDMEWLRSLDEHNRRQRETDEIDARLKAVADAVR